MTKLLEIVIILNCINQQIKRRNGMVRMQEIDQVLYIRQLKQIIIHFMNLIMFNLTKQQDIPKHHLIIIHQKKFNLIIIKRQKY